MNNTLKTLLAILLFTTVGVIKAQNARVDSLSVLLNNHKQDDSVRVSLLNKVGYAIVFSDSSKAREYADQASLLADKIGYLKGKAESFWVMGTLSSFYKSDKIALDYFLKALEIAEEINSKPEILKYLISSGNKYAAIGNISGAMESYERAMKIAEELQSKQSIARCLGNICVTYTGQGNYEKAIEGYQKLLMICEEIKDKKIESATLNNLGNISQYQGNNIKALEYFLKSLKIREELNDRQGLANSYINIGSVIALQTNYPKALEYFEKALKLAVELNEKRLISQCYEDIGDIYLQSNDFKALEYLQKALAIAEELSYTTPMITRSIKIGDYYRVHGSNRKALDYYKKALALSEEMKRKRTICEIWSKMGAVYLVQKEYSTALSYTLKSLDIANELNLLNNQKDIHSQLSEIYYFSNDYKNAYNHQKFFKTYSDSIYNEKNVRKIAELEYSYKFEKEKRAIELEQQKKDAVQAVERKQHKTIIFSLFTGLMLTILLIVYIYRSYRIKQKTNIILSQQKHEIEEKNEELKLTNEQLIESQAINKALMEKEIERMNLELESNQKSMTAATLKLIQNSERDAQTIDRLIEVEKNTNSEGKSIVNSIISDYKRLSYSSNWEEFEILFEKVHSSFYENLNSRFPDLTSNERKMCAFLKLNMSSKEIAQITFQSDDALKKARLRLRQKLGIDRDTNLTVFIQSI